MLLNRNLYVIETKNKYNFGNFWCSVSKYLYLFRELCYIRVKCGLGTQNLVRHTEVFVITGFVISGVLPIKITVILLGSKNYFVITGTSFYRGSTVQLYSKILTRGGEGESEYLTLGTPLNQKKI